MNPGFMGVSVRLNLRCLQRLLAKLLFVLVLLQPLQNEPALAKDQIFYLNNHSEPETLDPGLSHGRYERNILMTLFEGLVSLDPKTLEALPGTAKSWQVKNGGLVYDFVLRKNARWSDGKPVTSEDFVFAWKRILDPKFASPNAYHLYPIKNAKAYHLGQPIVEANTETTSQNTSQKAKKTRNATFADVGIRPVSSHRLVVTLEQPTPYFLFLTGLDILAPVPKHVVKKHGKSWTQAKKIVTNGPFRLQEWKPSYSLSVERNPNYWDVSQVRLNKVVFFAISNRDTALKMYETGKLHWSGSALLPDKKLDVLSKRNDYHQPLKLAAYFLRLNTARPPLDNVHVRRALYLAIDRESLVKHVTKAGDRAAYSLTPDYIGPYKPPAAPKHSPQQALVQFEKAGYCGPKKLSAARSKNDCKPFPKMSILFNKSERHENVMLAILSMWRQHLGIESIDLERREWKVYLSQQRRKDYWFSRAGWIADYPDPQAFLELFLKDGPNNLTGFDAARFDDRIRTARTTANPQERHRLFAEAEALLLQEMPILPLFHYTAPYLLKAEVGGFYGNILDLHPLKSVFIQPSSLVQR